MPLPHAQRVSSEKAAKLGITREPSIILQINELKSKKTWLEEAYRNSYSHFIDPWAAVAVYTDTNKHTHTLPYTSLAYAHRDIITAWDSILMVWNFCAPSASSWLPKINLLLPTMELYFPHSQSVLLRHL